MSDACIQSRYALAQTIARQAGRQALAWFRRRDQLVIESKGLQDMVSAADKDTELYIRAHVAAHFVGDGFLGEEGGLDSADATYLWVIDPIDGTACFVNGMHAWCVSIAITHRGLLAQGVAAATQDVAGRVVACDLRREVEKGLAEAQRQKLALGRFLQAQGGQGE